MVENEVADSADAFLDEFCALLISGIDGGAMPPEPLAGDCQRDGIKAANEGEGEGCIKRIDGDQQRKDEDADQNCANCLNALNNEVEYQQVDLVERGQMFA